MFLSVIVPVYNKYKYVANAINSVLSQTYENIEIIVVDDGSTDRSVDIVKSFSDSRIRLLIQPHGGVASARNTGIHASKGDWVAFLDADDVWLPNNIKSHVFILEKNPDVCWSSGLFNRICNNKVIKTELPKRISDKINNGITYHSLDLFFDAKICTITTIINKNVFSEIGYFDVNLKTAEDIDMWLRLCMQYPKMGYCKDPIAQYNIDTPNSLTKIYNNSDDLLPCEIFIKKYLSLLCNLSDINRNCLIRYFNTILRHNISNLLLQGNKYKARNTLDRFKNILSFNNKHALLVLSYVPTQYLRKGYECFCFLFK